MPDLWTDILVCKSGVEYRVSVTVFAENSAEWATSTMGELLSLLDVVVDGEFVEEKKNLRLAFRGSENQRIIDVKESLKQGRTICLG